MNDQQNIHIHSKPGLARICLHAKFHDRCTCTRVHDCLYKIFLGHIFQETINTAVWFLDYKLPSWMYACLGMFLPEDMHGNGFDGLLVCMWDHLSMCTDHQASGTEHRDALVSGSKSTELVVLPHSVICAYWRVVLSVWDWHICWICVSWDVSGCGWALLEKGFASGSSLLVHGTHTKVHFLHPPQLSSPICTPWGRHDPSGTQPGVGTHTSPAHPTPPAHPLSVAAAAKALSCVGVKKA